MCLHLELHYILENIYLKKFIWSLTTKIIILNSSYKVINGFLIRFMFMNYKREITRLKCQKKAFSPTKQIQFQFDRCIFKL